jgi:hypothetical protein
LDSHSFDPKGSVKGGFAAAQRATLDAPLGVKHEHPAIKVEPTSSPKVSGMSPNSVRDVSGLYIKPGDEGSAWSEPVLQNDREPLLERAILFLHERTAF